MKIKSITLKNFKRFSELTIGDIPESAKLVLLAGANGSGKSSVFDAFHWLSKGALRPLPYNIIEYQVKKLILISNDPMHRLVENILILPWKVFLERLWNEEII